MSNMSEEQKPVEDRLSALEEAIDVLLKTSMLQAQYDIFEREMRARLDDHADALMRLNQVILGGYAGVASAMALREFLSGGHP